MVAALAHWDCISMKAQAVASVRTSVEAAKTAHDAGWRWRCLSMLSSADMWMRTPGAKGASGVTRRSYVPAAVVAMNTILS
jgi:hypothetical protein